MRQAFSSSAAIAALGMLALAASLPALAAGGISVRILDRDGRPVPEVVVSARLLDAVRLGAAVGDATTDAVTGSPAVPPTAEMNQRGLAFEPHVLIVETGTEVSFPNADDVRHHVYSFSPAMRFDFSVDSESSHAGLRFDTPGVATLGCNIHDEMLAYIVVVATPHFAKTGPDGSAELSGLAAGRYELAIWTSRVAAKHLPQAIEIAVVEGEFATSEYRFAEKLYPPHRHSDTSLHWSHY